MTKGSQHASIERAGGNSEDALRDGCRLPLPGKADGLPLGGVDDIVGHREAFGWRFIRGHVRTLIAVMVVAAGYFFQDQILTAPYHHARTWLGISPPPPHTLVCSAFSILVSFRLIWWLAIARIVAFVDPPGIAPLLRYRRRALSYLLKGMAIGFAVMSLTILTIVAVGAAHLCSSPGSAIIHIAHGTGWLLAETIGAAEEEVLFRGLLLVLVNRLLGERATIVITALAFSLAHGANPSASSIWMVRLAAAGALLAYSVFRSGTVWWGIGYHAGWNFASAPFFGAVGSGYRNEGHILSLLPSGSAVITGGTVGPEGSIFAFLAVVIGVGLLVLTVPQDRKRRNLQG